MKKNGDSVRDWAGKIFRRFLSRTSLMVTLGVLGLYLICCLFYWYAEFGGPKGTAFYNVLLWNTATLFGQDYADHYPESVGGRLLGIVVLLISMFGVSAVTGYISSYLIERRANSVRGLKKLQSLRNHIIICGWKNNQKGLILDIKRKNKELKLSDMVLINNRDEEQIRFFLADEELRGIQYVHGDFSEEDVLKRANAKYASKALILGEEDDGLTPELIDSRVFAAMLMLKGMNPKIHICAQVQTKKYKNYLESNKCDEVIYSEEYTGIFFRRPLFIMEWQRYYLLYLIMEMASVSRFSIWMSRGMEKHLRKYPDITKNTIISWCLEFWKIWVRSMS